MKIKARLFLPLTFKVGEHILLPTDHAQYVKNVMRAKVGYFIGVFNGQDGEYAAEILSVERKAVSIKIGEKIRDHLEPENITLLFAMVKKTPMEYIIQKGTELGCGVFQPITTDYTNSKDYNFERFQRIAIEAAEQCTLTAVPEINAPIALGDALADFNHIIFCAEKGTSDPIAKHLKQAEDIDAILIGPEGGFSPEEHEMLRKSENCFPVSLGPRIMRAETAAAAALSAYLFDKENK